MTDFMTHDILLRHAFGYENLSDQCVHINILPIVCFPSETKVNF